MGLVTISNESPESEVRDLQMGQLRCSAHLQGETQRVSRAAAEGPQRDRSMQGRPLAHQRSMHSSQKVCVQGRTTMRFSSSKQMTHSSGAASVKGCKNTEAVMLSARGRAQSRLCREKGGVEMRGRMREGSLALVSFPGGLTCRVDGGVEAAELLQAHILALDDMAGDLVNCVALDLHVVSLG